MLIKIAALFALAATSHLEQGKNMSEWVFDSGPNKGYLCAMMQPNGTGFDVYVPALWPNPAQTPGTAAKLTAVPWLHFANQRDAVDATNAYCPANGAAQMLLD